MKRGRRWKEQCVGELAVLNFSFIQSTISPQLKDEQAGVGWHLLEPNVN